MMYDRNWTRRDQRTVAPLHGLPVGPVSLSTSPVPLHNRALVTSGNLAWAARAAGFRYAGSGITEVIPHPVLCRMSVGFGFETIRLSVCVRHKSERH